MNSDEKEILAQDFDISLETVDALLQRVTEIETGQYGTEPVAWDEFERERWFERWSADDDSPPRSVTVGIVASMKIELSLPPWATHERIIELLPPMWAEAMEEGLISADFGPGDEHDWIAGIDTECTGLQLTWAWDTNESEAK